MIEWSQALEENVNDLRKTCISILFGLLICLVLITFYFDILISNLKVAGIIQRMSIYPSVDSPVVCVLSD